MIPVDAWSNHQTSLPLGRWPDLSRYEPADGRALAVVAVAAVAADVAIRSEIVGVGGATAVAAVALGPVAAGRVGNRRAVALLCVAALLGAFFALRSNPVLLLLDLVAAGGLVVLGASFAKDGDPFDQTVGDVGVRAVCAIAHAVLAPGFVASAVRVLRKGRGATTSAPSPTSWGAVVRGVLLALPIVLLVGALLASADAVFASFFRVPADLGELAVHALLLAIGAWTAGAALRSASGEAAERSARVPRSVVGTTEAMSVLVALATLLTVFAAAQVVAAVGGHQYVERRVGLSYAEHARSGFFQLLAVSAVVLAVLLGVEALSRRARAVVVAVEVVVALTLVVVVVALRRLFLYEAAYGLTLLRVAAVVFAVWIGIVFVLVAIRFAGVAADRAWLLPAATTAAVVLLVAANLVNLDALVVERNVDRFAGTDRLDLFHLTSLGDDALPALVDAVPHLAVQDAEFVRSQVCVGGDGPGGFWRWNRAVAAADRARAQLCPQAESTVRLSK
ncbi:MAG TPA: DUF4173 domain-containing protein [Acidimicrobiales bacterium]|nr:DUF4173 domain-containing protein [Acidimicrobiales bacterium]